MYFSLHFFTSINKKREFQLSVDLFSSIYSVKLLVKTTLWDNVFLHQEHLVKSLKLRPTVAHSHSDFYRTAFILLLSLIVVLQHGESTAHYLRCRQTDRDKCNCGLWFGRAFKRKSSLITFLSVCQQGPFVFQRVRLCMCVQNDPECM